MSVKINIKIRSSMKLKSFQEWLSEDASFSSIGAPPSGNVSGMGLVVAPSSTVGSGDAWPSLGKPSSLVSLVKKRKRRKKRKLEEASGSQSDVSFKVFDLSKWRNEEFDWAEKWIGKDAAINPIFHLICKSSSVDTNSPNSSKEWLQLFDYVYDLNFSEWTTNGAANNLIRDFGKGEYEWGAFLGPLPKPTPASQKDQDEDFYDHYVKYEAKIDSMKKEGWETFAWDSNDDTFQALLRRKLTQEEKKKRSKDLAQWLRETKHLLSREDIKTAGKLLLPEDFHEIRGMLHGANYDV